jgi:hypothetical protein
MTAYSTARAAACGSKRTARWPDVTREEPTYRRVHARRVTTFFDWEPFTVR